MWFGVYIYILYYIFFLLLMHLNLFLLLLFIKDRYLQLEYKIKQTTNNIKYNIFVTLTSMELLKQ